MKTIGVVCPTRGRPGLARKMYESAMDTSTDAEVFFYVCEDEVGLYEQANVINPDWSGLVGPDQALISKFNLLARRFPRPLTMMMTDDVVFEAPGWDDRIKAEFDKVPDRLLCVCPADGRDDRSRTFWTVSREWMGFLGYFMPPHFTTFYGDSWVSELAEGAGRLVYLPDVVCRHTKISDETRRSTRNNLAKDTRSRKMMNGVFARDLDRLRAAL
jgi:hypothetical protein